jgi:hypothetical protein
MQDLVATVGLVIGGAATIGFLIGLVETVRAARAGAVSEWGGRAILGSFGVLIVGASLVPVSVGLDVARLVGAAGVMTGLAVLALATRIRPVGRASAGENTGVGSSDR